MAYRIIRLPKVKELTGLSRTTIYARMSRKEFPRSVGLGGRAIGWVEQEIQDWIEDCLMRSRNRSESFDI